MRSRLRDRSYESKAPGGYGSLTPKGYRRMYDPIQKRQRFEHVLVWEKYNGQIPEGLEIHHKDHDKLNNHISNLQLVDDVTQKRIHSGCVLKDGVWLKPCRRCGELKSVKEYYYKVKTRNSHVASWCKVCCVVNAVKNKRIRKLKGAQSRPAGACGQNYGLSRP